MTLDAKFVSDLTRITEENAAGPMRRKGGLRIRRFLPYSEPESTLFPQQQKAVDFLLDVAPIMEKYHSGGTAAAADSDALDDDHGAHHVTKRGGVRNVDMRSIMSVTNERNVSKLNDKYTFLVEGPDAVPARKTSYPQHAPLDDMCGACGTARINHEREGRMYCPKCGTGGRYMDTGMDSFPFGTEVESYGFSYERDSHLNDWFIDLQCIGRNDTRPEIIDAMHAILKKEHKSPASVTPKDTRTMIHTLFKSGVITDPKEKKRCLENHIPISFRVRGVEPPKMTTEQRDRFEAVWRRVQKVFESSRDCENGGINFMPYAIAIYNIYLLLEMDEFLEWVPLPENLTKRKEHMQTWKNICEKANLQYYELSTVVRG